jgi:hypothetical protein
MSDRARSIKSATSLLLACALAKAFLSLTSIAHDGHRLPLSIQLMCAVEHWQTEKINKKVNSRERAQRTN